jgi:hypothetical protein
MPKEQTVSLVEVTKCLQRISGLLHVSVTPGRIVLFARCQDSFTTPLPLPPVITQVMTFIHLFRHCHELGLHVEAAIRPTAAAQLCCDEL